MNPLVVHLFEEAPQPVLYTECQRCGCTNIKMSLLKYHRNYSPTAIFPVLSDYDIERIRADGYLNPVGTGPHEIHDVVGYLRIEAEEFLRIPPELFWKFTVVRDPIARFLSIAYTHIEQEPELYPQYSNHTWCEDSLADSEVINDYLENFFINDEPPAGQSRGRRVKNDPHIDPLHVKTGKNISAYNHIGSVEDLTPTMNQLKDVLKDDNFSFAGMKSGVRPNMHTAGRRKNSHLFFDYKLTPKSVETLLDYGYGLDYNMFEFLGYKSEYWLRSSDDRPKFLQKPNF